MAVFTKPINLSFELDPKKAKEFFKKSDKQAINNAIDRASKHEEKYKTRATEINPQPTQNNYCFSFNIIICFCIRCVNAFYGMFPYTIFTRKV